MGQTIGKKKPPIKGALMVGWLDHAPSAANRKVNKIKMLDHIAASSIGQSSSFSTPNCFLLILAPIDSPLLVLCLDKFYSVSWPDHATVPTYSGRLAFGCPNTHNQALRFR